MKKFLFLLLVLMLPSLASAETWFCTYDWEGQNKNIVVKRLNNKYFRTVYKDDKSFLKILIVKETKDFIHLYSNIDPFQTAFLRVMDKKNSSFVMVGLEYKNNTAIIEGPCIID
mgnify:CR=1 FL=1